MLTKIVVLSFFYIVCFIHLFNGDLSDRFIPNVNITTASFTVIVLCTNSKFFCSGVVVDPSWVLTAAHCFYNMVGELTENNSSVLVVGGSKGLYFAEADIKSGKAQIRTSKRVVIHDMYTWKENFVNDIALIEVSQKFEITERVSVAVLNRTNTDKSPALPNSHDHDVDEINWACSGYGFGKVEWSADDAEDYTIKGQEYIVNKHCHCLEWVRSYKSPVVITIKRNIFICESNLSKKTIRLSPGDNGGPLVCSGVLRAIGVTVFLYSDRELCQMEKNRESDSATYMTVFMDLCYFGEWLNYWVRTYPLLDEMCELVDAS